MYRPALAPGCGGTEEQRETDFLDPGVHATARKHLSDGPPRPSTPWTLLIDIHVALKDPQGVGGMASWPRASNPFI